MKKIPAIILSVFILALTTSNSFGQTIGFLKNIKYDQNGSQDIVSIYSTYIRDFKFFRLENPERIVVDIPNNLLAVKGSQTIDIGSSMINSIRFSQFTESISRVVIDVNGKPQYKVDSNSGCLTFIFGEQTATGLKTEDKSTGVSRGDVERGQTVGNDFKNVIYSSNNETASLLLQGAKLEEALPAGSDNGADAAAAFNPLFSEATDATGRTFTLSFPTVLANLGSGRMQINDKILESIEITNDLESQNTLITFNAKYTLIYDITYNPQTDNTEIHIIKPFTQTDKLVVIDPGHGGSDTGAFYAGISEKDLNLKIAMKVNDILKSYGINTYMTRTDDTYIPLHERAGIANNLNAALFLSVHNNSYNTSEYGTETLSYPTAASRQFAGIVQKTLVNALGTKNRGIIDRPNLVVLYETKMPAVIAEIAFITNTGDRKKLQDEQFMDKAAAALADSVLEALDTILIPQENQPAG